MSRKYLSFDIENAKITPDGDGIHDHRPLGICCWAIAWVDDGRIQTFASNGYTEQGEPAAQMSKEDCAELVYALLDYVREGYTLLTHNGVGFDLDIHCLKGVPVGLDAILKGMGLQGKTEGMNGLIAPKSGRRNHLAIPKWLTVLEALQWPEPDTSWMTEPMPRSRFTGWMEEVRASG